MKSITTNTHRTRSFRVFMGQSVVRSVHSLAKHCSLAPQCIFGTLVPLAHFIYSLLIKLRSLPYGIVDVHENEFALKTRLTGIVVFVVVTINTPTQDGSRDRIKDS